MKNAYDIIIQYILYSRTTNVHLDHRKQRITLGARCCGYYDYYNNTILLLCGLHLKETAGVLDTYERVSHDDDEL